MKKILIVLILTTCINIGFSQEKYEKEARIRAIEAPSKAKEFMDGVFIANKIKWYAEENLIGKAIEAKVKRNGKRYSIKFDTLGNLKDVEIAVDFNTIPEKTRIIIQGKLESLFPTFKIQKTQVQFLGEESVLRELIVKGITEHDHSTNYEIVIRGKKDRKVDYYEILFNEQGDLLRKERIIQKNTQRLIY